MALVAVNDGDEPDRAAIARALAGLPPGAPVVVMIHGLRYSPADPAADPHRLILSMAPDRSTWGAVSWPRRLGLGGAGGLGVAFGGSRAARSGRRTGGRGWRGRGWPG